MTKDISQAVREVCLSFPETEEFVSHGSPNFRVRKGKIFATYVVNHHGDGRIAERGRHDGLLSSGGLYARMWERQRREAPPQPSS